MAEIGSDAALVYIDDINGVMSSGVTQVPAIVVDGKIVSEGLVPDVRELKKMLDI